MFNADNLMRDYEAGLGYKKGDVLCPKQGANPATYEVLESKVVVLDQDCLAPHKYTVVGERQAPSRPSDRFVKFEINGHDWERV